MANGNSDQVNALLAEFAAAQNARQQAAEAPATPGGAENSQVSALVEEFNRRKAAAQEAPGGVASDEVDLESLTDSLPARVAAEQRQQARLSSIKGLLRLHDITGVTAEQALADPDLLQDIRDLAEIETANALQGNVNQGLADEGIVKRALINTGQALKETAAGWQQLWLLGGAQFGVEGYDEKLADFTRKFVAERQQFEAEANTQLADQIQRGLVAVAGGASVASGLRKVLTTGLKKFGKEVVDASMKTAKRRVAGNLLVATASGATQFANDGQERLINMALAGGMGGIASTGFEGARLAANRVRGEFRNQLKDAKVAERWQSAVAEADRAGVPVERRFSLGEATGNARLQELERIAAQSSKVANVSANDIGQRSDAVLNEFRQKVGLITGQANVPVEQLGARIGAVADNATAQLKKARTAAWDLKVKEAVRQSTEKTQRVAVPGTGTADVPLRTVERTVGSKILTPGSLVQELDGILVNQAQKEAIGPAAANALSRLSNGAVKGWDATQLDQNLQQIRKWADGDGLIPGIQDKVQSKVLAQRLRSAINSDIDTAPAADPALALIKEGRQAYRELSQEIKSIESTPIGMMLKRIGEVDAEGNAIVSPQRLVSTMRGMDPGQVKRFAELADKHDPSLMNAARANLIEETIESAALPAEVAERGASFLPGKIVNALNAPKNRAILGDLRDVKEIDDSIQALRRMASSGVSVKGATSGIASELQQQAPIVAEASTGSAPNLVFAVKALVSSATPKQLSKLLATSEGRRIVMNADSRFKDRFIGKAVSKEMAAAYGELVGLMSEITHEPVEGELEEE